MASVRKTLLAALKKVDTSGQNGSGICGQVQKLLSQTGEPPFHGEGKAMVQLHRMLEVWPNRSEMPQYPVPAPAEISFQGGDKAAEAFQAFYLLPRWEGEYGDSRRALLAYLIERLENGHGK